MEDTDIVMKEFSDLGRDKGRGRDRDEGKSKSVKNIDW